MNRDWSEKKKSMQKLLSPKATFSEGIEAMLRIAKALEK